MKKLAVLFVCAAMLASCDGFKGGSKDLKAENDSLLMELNQRNAELDDMMGTFNEVQEGFRKINAAESRVDLQRGTITENSASAKQQIASDIEFISKQMEENKAQIAKLQAQLKNSSYNSAQMKKAVAALTAELNAKQQRIEELQTELASKNIRIQELDAAVSDLSAAKETLVAENEAKAKTVAEQDKSLNAAWFVFGTKSELKAQKILQSGDVLKSADFNKDYFTQIDIRTTKEIKLYSKRAELLTTHPAGSYELVKDDKGQLMITNVETAQDGIHFGYLDMTQENILDQAKKLVGMAYGWGDSNGDMDCSSTMNAIYRCFGIVLPRNTSSMAQTGTQIVSLEGMTQEEKLEKIQSMNPGTLLVMKNHVVMYIGQENGEDLILHNFTTCMADDGVSTKEVYQCQNTQLNLVTAAGTQYLDAYATAICFPED